MDAVGMFSFFFVTAFMENLFSDMFAGECIRFADVQKIAAKAAAQAAHSYSLAGASMSQEPKVELVSRLWLLCSLEEMIVLSPKRHLLFTPLPNPMRCVPKCLRGALLLCCSTYADYERHLIQ